MNDSDGAIYPYILGLLYFQEAIIQLLWWEWILKCKDYTSPQNHNSIQLGTIQLDWSIQNMQNTLIKTNSKVLL